jgi:hypothetical protein
MAAPAASRMMPVTVAMAALYEHDTVTAGEHIWICNWHRHRR